MHILKAASEKANLNQAESAELRQATTELLKHLAAEHARRHGNKKWPRPDRPYVRQPRYAVLLSGHDCQCGQIHTWADCQTLLSPTFRALAWDAVTGLMRLQSLIPTSHWQEMGLAYRLSWSVRCLIQANPNLEFDGLREMLAARSQIRAAYAARHQRLAEARGYAHLYGEDDIDTIGEHYVGSHLSNLYTLLSGRVRYKRPSHARLSQASRIWQREAQSVEAAANLLPSAPDALQIISPSLASRQVRHLIQQGLAADDDDGDLLLQSPTPSAGKQDFLQRIVRAGLIYSREESVPWGRSAPGFFALAQVYGHCFPRPWIDLEPAHRLASFEAIIYLHTGIHPEILAQVRVGRASEAESLLWKHGIYLDPDLRALVLQAPVVLARTQGAKDLRRHQVSAHGLPDYAVICPLPPLLSAMLDYLIRHDFPAQGNQRWIPPDTPRTQVLAEGPTPIKLCRAYSHYYCGWYGLDPELSSLVAGQPMAHRSANSHYFQSTYQALAKTYHQVFTQFHADILASAQAASIQVCLPDLAPHKLELPQAKLGSRVTPELNDVTRWIEQLKRKLEETRTAIPRNIDNWRNLFCIYIYEALKIATGLRALSVPPFRSFSLVGDRRWLRLAEKASAGWDEWRIVPVHPRVRTLIFTLLDYNNLIFARRHGGVPQAKSLPNPQSIFFATKDGQALPLSFGLLKSTVKAYALEYPPFAANAYRHLLRYWLHRQGCTHRLADFALGHHRRSPHALDRLSLTPLARLEEDFLLAVEGLLDEVGLGKIETI